MANELASFLVPIGVVGAVIAVLCAIVAAVAIVRGAGGLSGGAVGVWIPAAMLSSTASFANQWIPLIVSGSALVGMLVIGAVVRAIVNAGASGVRAARPVRVAAPAVAQTAATASAPRATAVSKSTVPKGAVSTSTGSLPALAG